MEPITRPNQELVSPYDFGSGGYDTFSSVSQEMFPPTPAIHPYGSVDGTDSGNTFSYDGSVEEEDPVEWGGLFEAPEKNTHKYIRELRMHDNTPSPEDVFRYVLTARLFQDVGPAIKNAINGKENSFSTGYMVLVSTSPNKIPFDSLDYFVDYMDIVDIESVPHFQRILDGLLNLDTDMTCLLDTYNQTMCDATKLYVNKDDLVDVREEVGNEYGEILRERRKGTRNKTAMEIAPIAEYISRHGIPRNRGKFEDTGELDDRDKYKGTYVITASQTPDYGLLGPVRMYGPKHIEYECRVIMPGYESRYFGPVLIPMVEIIKYSGFDKPESIVQFPLENLFHNTPQGVYNILTKEMKKGLEISLPLPVQQ